MQKPYAWAKKLCWIEGALDHSLRRILHLQFKNSNVLHQFDCYFRLLRNNKGFEMSNATPSITKLRLIKFQTFMLISLLREMKQWSASCVWGFCYFHGKKTDKIWLSIQFRPCFMWGVYKDSAVKNVSY